MTKQMQICYEQSAFTLSFFIVYPLIVLHHSRSAEAADELFVFDVEDSVGCAVVRAAGTGIDHPDMTAVVTVDGDVFRLMGVSEQENIRFFCNGVVGGKLTLGFYEQFMTMGKQEFQTSCRDHFFLDQKFPVTVGEKHFVAVAAYVIERNVREMFVHERDGVVHSVTEEKDAVNAAVFQMDADGVSHTDGIAVDIGKYEDFHKNLRGKKLKEDA